MIPDSLLSIIYARVKHDLVDRHRTVANEAGRIRETMSARGALQSGMTIRQLVDLIGNEYRVRVTLIWHAIVRALSQSGVRLSPDLAADLKSRLTQLLVEHSDDLPQLYASSMNLMGGGGGFETIEVLRTAALERICNEIDYAAIPSEDPVTGPTVNIYQTYGIVQTGASSTASLAVTVSDDERRELTEVLTQLRELFGVSGELGDIQRNEALEVVTELEEEIERAQPNGSRIRGLLQSLAATVQTMAASPEAYNLLKGAAALFGIALP